MTANAVERARRQAGYQQVLTDYLAAYAAANPGQTPPQIEYVGNGYFRLHGGFLDKRVRPSKIQQMTARLRSRASA